MQCDQKYKIKLFTSICVIVCLYLMTIYFDIKLENLSEKYKHYFSKSILPSQLNNVTKTILYWTTMWGDETFYLGLGNIAKHCPGMNDKICLATHDRYSLNINDFDVLLFHGNELDVNDLPPKRNPNQVYVFTNLESPANHPLLNHIFENYFNYTMTYRMDSDIVWPYFVITNKITKNIIWPIHGDDNLWKLPFNATDSRPFEPERLKNHIKTKHKTVAWFVSNCHSKSAREKYVEDLSNHIDVDIYGNCGPKHCSRDEDCFETIIEPEYFFYLSFENSLCQDYVTEKLYNTLKYDVIPVVYGGANYSRFAPPNSYINALDFDSPKNLANFLKKLMKDKNKYLEYFKWKKLYEVVAAEKLAVCELCHLIHNTNQQPKIYNPLTEWYETNKCPLQDKLQYLPYLTKSAV